METLLRYEKEYLEMLQKHELATKHYENSKAKMLEMLRLYQKNPTAEKKEELDAVIKRLKRELYFITKMLDRMRQNVLVSLERLDRLNGQ